jgi:hypothetical protein
LGPWLPDGLFSNQNPNLGKFWRALDWKMLMYFMAIWNIFWTFWIFSDRFGIMHQEKSGNPGRGYQISIFQIFSSTGSKRAGHPLFIKSLAKVWI